METTSKTKIKILRYQDEFDTLTYSNVAELKGIDNRTISLIEHDNLLNLIQFVYIPLRTDFNDLKVTSGFRCWELNKLVGGVSNSQHLRGQAMDFICEKRSNLHAAWNRLQEMNIDQAIKYKDFIHVSFVSLKANRNQYIDKSITK